MGRRKTSSKSSAKTDELPPWERELVVVTSRLQLATFERLQRLSAGVDLPKTYIVDALLRSLGEAELRALLEEQVARDGAARAAWSRGS